MKSKLSCQKCGLERISFDEYTTLSLPLPESSLINLKIVIRLLPDEIKNALSSSNCQEDSDLMMQKVLEEKLIVSESRKTLQFDH